MTKPVKLLLALTLGVGACTGYWYLNRHPASATLPPWIMGEFVASAERYAGRSVSLDSTTLRFTRGAGDADVLPIEWIEETPDSRPHLRILDLHVKDGDKHSTIRVVASGLDSSFRLQTMPDVAWRQRADHEARADRMAAREREATPATAVAMVQAPSRSVAASPAVSDTMIGEQRFADRDPAARDELAQVVQACRRYGCRIGIRGLQESRFAEFATYLRALGADSVSITPERSANTTLAMLEISRTRTGAMR